MELTFSFLKNSIVWTSGKQVGHGPRTDRTAIQGGEGEGGGGGGQLAVVNEHCCGWTSCWCERINRDKDERRRVVKPITASGWLLEAALIWSI